MTPAQERCSLQHGGQQRANFLASAAWQQRNHRPLQVQPVQAAKLRNGMFRLQPLQQRMADKMGANAVTAEERRLKVKEYGHLVDVVGHFGGALRPPGPDLRRDIIKGSHPQGFGCTGETQIEPRIIDQHQHIGFAGLDLGEEMVKNAAKVEIVPRHFDKADVRELAHVVIQRHAGRLHRISADAENLCRWIELFEGCDQPASVHIAGRLAGTDHDSGGHGGA